MLDKMAESLSENLKKHGITVLKCSREEQDCDPALWITDNIHLQVGYDYVQIVKEEANEKFTMVFTDGSIKDIIKKLKEIV
jgi:hypothetical protein